jgi:hypothetical protein
VLAKPQLRFAESLWRLIEKLRSQVQPSKAVDKARSVAALLDSLEVSALPCGCRVTLAGAWQPDPL